MKSVTTRQFREAYAKLPARVRQQARRAYHLFRRDPSHPSLNFKRLEQNESIYSIRIGISYRALGTRDGADIVWYWIGAHSEYDRLV